MGEVIEFPGGRRLLDPATVIELPRDRFLPLCVLAKAMPGTALALATQLPAGATAIGMARDLRGIGVLASLPAMRPFGDWSR